MKQVTIHGIFYIQVCSDESIDDIIKWVQENEVSSAEWMLATPEIMRAYGANDPNIVECAEKPEFKHYLLVAKGWFDG